MAARPPRLHPGEPYGLPREAKPARQRPGSVDPVGLVGAREGRPRFEVLAVGPPLLLGGQLRPAGHRAASSWPSAQPNGVVYRFYACWLLRRLRRPARGRRTGMLTP